MWGNVEQHEDGAKPDPGQSTVETPEIEALGISAFPLLMHDLSQSAPLCPDLNQSQLYKILQYPPYFQSSHWET